MDNPYAIFDEADLHAEEALTPLIRPSCGYDYDNNAALHALALVNRAAEALREGRHDEENLWDRLNTIGFALQCAIGAFEQGKATK